MAVKIRLSRIGKKHVPFFRIIAIDSRKKRDGAYLENLGTYDVHNNTFVQFHEERINHWVSQGAVVTDSVKKLQREFKQGSGVTSKKGAVIAPKAKNVAVDAQESKN